jgi:flagellar hook protein FlgE
MLRSMFSAVSGLRSHQTMMDVVGNNIANVNTTGYKSSSTVFEDTLSQTIRGAGASGDTIAGTNAAQVGLGVKVAGTNTSFTQGASQVTGRATDLAIQGDGFFVTRMAGEELFTRAGSPNVDSSGLLATVDGAVIQGWSADPETGEINRNGTIGNLTIPLGQLKQPKATDEVGLAGNLSAAAPVGTVSKSSITVYDRSGDAISLTVNFTKTADNEWSVTTTGAGGSEASGTLTFGAGGLPSAYPTLTATLDDGSSINLDMGSAADALNGVTQFGGDNNDSVAATDQNGWAMGFLRSYTIAQDGTVNGVFSNGRTQALGQIALATFNNPGGLEKVGNSAFRATVNSGIPQIGTAGSASRGLLAGGTLEMSNVDLAQEFTTLITAQRGFQANSRVISASDELLQDLVNLKR